MKLCPKCNTEKSESEFAFKNKAKGLLHTNCRDCHNLYTRKHYQNNKEKYIANARSREDTYYERTQNFVNTYKSSKGCQCCSENNPVCLDFHHLNEDEKSFNISNKYYLSPENLMKEIEKCIVVCCNCHRKIHANVIKL